jgi:hypothetical protein
MLEHKVSRDVSFRRRDPAAAMKEDTKAAIR